MKELQYESPQPAARRRVPTWQWVALAVMIVVWFIVLVVIPILERLISGQPL